MTQSSPRFLSAGLRRALASRLAARLTFPHGVDGYLEQFDRRWSVREVRATLVALRRQTADSVTVQLRPNGNWRGFRAGQYVRLSVDIDGVRRTRCFSPANSARARDGLIELSCRIGPRSLVARYLSERVRPGEVLRLSQAEGEFALPELRPARVLLISGGSGITPVLAMLRTLCDEGHSGPITFLHYANRAADMLYAAELAELAARHPNVNVVRVFGEAGGELQGLFCREHLLAAAPDYAQAETFLCGPAGMMQVVQELYAAEGLSGRLHLEHFAAPMPATAVGSETRGEVRFARSERYVMSDGRSLLEQAEAAGLKPDSGCRMGICHTCTCRKTNGQVRDIRNGRLSESGEEAIQLCVSVPVGAVTLDL